MNPEDILDLIGETSIEYISPIIDEAPRPKSLFPRKIILIAAVISMLTLLVGCVAYVGFVHYENPMEMLNDFFGNRQYSDVEGSLVEETLGDEVVTIPQPSVQHVPLDPETAKKVSPYVGDVNRTIAWDDYTLTVKAHVYDSVTACGVIYYTVSKENGVIPYQTQYDGTIWNLPVDISNSNGENFLLPESSTAQSISVAHYYMRTPDDTENSITLSFNSSVLVDPSDYDVVEGFEQKKDHIHLPLNDGGGMDGLISENGSIRISPIAISLNIENMDFLCRDSKNGSNRAGQIQSLTLNYTDGSQYIIEGNNQLNYGYACTSMDGQDISYVFNRLVNLEELLSVEINNVAITDFRRLEENERIRSALYTETEPPEEMNTVNGDPWFSENGSQIILADYVVTGGTLSYEAQSQAGCFHLQIENSKGLQSPDFTDPSSVRFTDGVSLEINHMGYWSVEQQSDKAVSLIFHFVQMDMNSSFLKLYFKGSAADVSIDSATADMLCYPITATSRAIKAAADGAITISSYGMDIDITLFKKDSFRSPTNLYLILTDGTRVDILSNENEVFTLNGIVLDTRIFKGSADNNIRVAFPTVLDVDQLDSIYLNGSKYPVD